MERRVSKSYFEAPRVCLAPMAGYSDAPFRLICGELGADFAFTGLVSADGLARGVKKSEALLKRLEGEPPLGVQLFGATPETLARSAAIAESAGASFIDLNFGCPVKKVVRKNGGAALMRDLDLMERITRGVLAAVSLPVTAKIRSGWTAEERNFREAACMLAGCGSRRSRSIRGRGARASRERLTGRRSACCAARSPFPSSRMETSKASTITARSYG